MRAATQCESRDVPDLIVPELEAELGQVRRPWTEREKEIMRVYYGRVSTAKIAEHVGKTVSGVQSQAHRMGLRAS